MKEEGLATIIVVLAVVGICLAILLVVLPQINPPPGPDGKGPPSDDPFLNRNLNTQEILSRNIVYQDQRQSLSAEVREFFPEDQPEDRQGPWQQSLHWATSLDGKTFEDQGVFVHHAGVPHLFITTDQRLIATFQYFSPQEKNLFDTILYTVSTDNGQTWSQATTFKQQGFPRGPAPADPFLVQQADGRIRFYFTFETAGDRGPQLYSALAEDIDKVFVFEGRQLQVPEGILDPVIIKFQDTWHHFTSYHREGVTGTFRNFHSISADGTNFAPEDDIKTGINMLGDVIEDGGRLVFYGDDGDGIITTAISADGYDWELGSSTGLGGADPGIAKLPDGSYYLIYTYLE